MDEELCSADEVLWCSPAHEEPDVLTSSTSGSTTVTAPVDVARGPTPYLGGYDDDTSPSYGMLLEPEPTDGIPPMLRRPDPEPAVASRPPRRSMSARDRRHAETEEENREGMERLDHASEALDIVAECSEAARGHEIPVVGGVGEFIGMGAGLSHTMHGLVTTVVDDDAGEGVPEMLEGTGEMIGNGAGLGLRIAGVEGSVVPDMIEDVGATAAGGAEIVDGAIMTADGDDAHGVPRMADGAVDAGLGLAGLGVMGGEAAELARGPGGLVVGGAATLIEEGRPINEHDGTFGTAVAPDGTEHNMNSYEFAVANGTDCYETMHDYFAGDAEEGSAREIAAEVGGGVLGGLVGLGAGVVGVGGDLVAGARARSSMVDDAWSWMMD